MLIERNRRHKEVKCVEEERVGGKESVRHTGRQEERERGGADKQTETERTIAGITAVKC